MPEIMSSRLFRYRLNQGPLDEATIEAIDAALQDRERLARFELECVKATDLYIKAAEIMLEARGQSDREFEKFMRQKSWS